MANLKIGPIEFASKDFHRQAPITVLSDKVSSKNGNDWRYIVGYQVDGGAIITLFIKTSRNVFSPCVPQYNKNSAYPRRHRA